ncbi:hypothetical protein V3565_04240 [Bartonella sp. B10]
MCTYKKWNRKTFFFMLMIVACFVFTRSTVQGEVPFNSHNITSFSQSAVPLSSGVRFLDEDADAPIQCEVSLDEDADAPIQCEVSPDEDADAPVQCEVSPDEDADAPVQCEVSLDEDAEVFAPDVAESQEFLLQKK